MNSEKARERWRRWYTRHKELDPQFVEGRRKKKMAWRRRNPGKVLAMSRRANGKPEAKERDAKRRETLRPILRLKHLAHYYRKKNEERERHQRSLAKARELVKVADARAEQANRYGIHFKEAA